MSQPELLKSYCAVLDAHGPNSKAELDWFHKYARQVAHLPFLGELGRKLLDREKEAKIARKPCIT